MMSAWWWMWMAFMFLLLVPQIGYGWGYRGWGPPYPRYVQRRRGERAAATGGSATFNHTSWGWRGDFVWGVLLVGLFWAFSGLLWWR
jgi:hypothetical protein